MTFVAVSKRDSKTYMRHEVKPLAYDERVSVTCTDTDVFILEMPFCKADIRGIRYQVATDIVAIQRQSEPEFLAEYVCHALVVEGVCKLVWCKACVECKRLFVSENDIDYDVRSGYGIVEKIGGQSHSLSIYGLTGRNHEDYDENIPYFEIYLHQRF